MIKTYRPYEPDQILLLPSSLQDWLPAVSSRDDGEGSALRIQSFPFFVGEHLGPNAGREGLSAHAS